MFLSCASVSTALHCLSNSPTLQLGDLGMVDEKELIISPFPRIDLMQEMLRLKEEWKRAGKSTAELASIDTYAHAHTYAHTSNPTRPMLIFVGGGGGGGGWVVLLK
jgi:hypothetical protein